MSEEKSDWNEYSRLVLNQLEHLATSIQALNSEIQELKQEIARMREREDRVDELRAWRAQVDEVASPSQLQVKLSEVEDLKLFKTKAVTIFAVVQFAMGFVIWYMNIFNG